MIDFDGQDIIDSRDLIERVSMLEAEDTLDEDEREELNAINELANMGIEDWQYGATLILDSYFVTYAQDLAEDIGAINADAAWPANCIDWERAADELKQDYTEVEFKSYTYYVRA